MKAGRGCLVGPVTAAAIILPLISKIHLNDSNNHSNKGKLKPILEQCNCICSFTHFP
jgi:ribonuclease HII